MPHNLINQLETAQRITLGQVDQESITMAVECSDSLAIVKHGRVESYLVPAELMQSLIDAHNMALGEMGRRVADSVPLEKPWWLGADIPVLAHRLKANELVKAKAP